MGLAANAVDAFKQTIKQLQVLKIDLHMILGNQCGGQTVALGKEELQAMGIVVIQAFRFNESLWNYKYIMHHGGAGIV